jgi:hypothetical protein
VVFAVCGRGSLAPLCKITPAVLADFKEDVEATIKELTDMGYTDDHVFARHKMDPRSFVPLNEQTARILHGLRRSFIEDKKFLTMGLAYKNTVTTQVMKHLNYGDAYPSVDGLLMLTAKAYHYRGAQLNM